MTVLSYMCGSDAEMYNDKLKSVQDWCNKKLTRLHLCSYIASYPWFVDNSYGLFQTSLLSMAINVNEEASLAQTDTLLIKADGL